MAQINNLMAQKIWFKLVLKDLMAQKKYHPANLEKTTILHKIVSIAKLGTAHF